MTFYANQLENQFIYCTHLLSFIVWLQDIDFSKEKIQIQIQITYKLSFEGIRKYTPY